MFFPEARVRVFLHGQPVDMRKSFDGLIALTRRALGQDPLCGHVFAFVNCRGNYLKALYFDRSGFCLESTKKWALGLRQEGVLTLAA
jgi:transposase